MRLVVADTAPLNYLILIEQVELLSTLFERYSCQNRCEMNCCTPMHPMRCANGPPTRPHGSRSLHHTDDPALERLDDGERAAIALAIRIGAELILMDDRDGVIVARSKGFAVTGTLGILDIAARRDLIRLDEALERLKATSFRYRPEIMDALLAKHSAERKGGR